MQFKTLQIGDDLRERISYNSHSIPLSICVDNFDDYFKREWSCHWHDEFEFAVVLKGTVEYIIYDDKEKVASKILHKGDGIFLNTRCLHSAKGLEIDTILAGFVFPVAFFNMKPFENLYSQNIDPIINSEITNIVLSGKNKYDQQLLCSMKELCEITDKEIGYELHSIEIICKIWRILISRISKEKESSCASSANHIQTQRLKKILSFVHEHFNQPINIDDMAKSAEISRTECFRCFQTIIKKSPMEYVTEYRLSMATMMLSTTSRTVSDIAYACGFNTPSYFGKLFREQCGLSPKEYRKQNHINV